ncbi:helix-turn-helix domain-containing protein, partial [Micromonospora sp. LOL_015]|uniref:helix-turn-helix domain-containing protein n=1 Tax=Micromonospora sp. LOL_015 TaxID=3345416 RepID=UPI003A84454E
MSGSSPLTIEERETISRELSRGGDSVSARTIGRLLGRHHSTIAREIARNGGSWDYRAVEAQARCDGNRLRPKPR